MMLEKRLDSLLGVEKHGPNCWNATVIYFDPSARVGYTEEKDMEYWLRLNTWKVKQDEVQTGDILVMRYKNSLVHTAVLIARRPALFFHKPGIAYAWEIHAEEEVMEIYGPICNAYQWHRVGSVISKVGEAA